MNNDYHPFKDIARAVFQFNKITGAEEMIIGTSS